MDMSPTTNQHAFLRRPSTSRLFLVAGVTSLVCLIVGTLLYPGLLLFTVSVLYFVSLPGAFVATYFLLMRMSPPRDGD